MTTNTNHNREAVGGSAPTLRRSLSLPLVTFYGLGTIVGAGIYVLVSEVAGISGPLTPVAFVMAAIIAAITALAYADLSAKLPKSAGEAVYVEAAFKQRLLTQAVGWGVVLTGIISSATIINGGFVGYLAVFITDVGRDPTIIILTLVLGAIAMWGITESVTVASIVTIIEIVGLFFVIVIAGDALAGLPQLVSDIHHQIDFASAAPWIAILSGTVIAFYAFIGFEDIVNLAEETKNPQTTLPKAIIWSLVVSTALYTIIAVIAILALPIDELAGAGAPLAKIVESRGYDPKLTIGLVSLLAVTNGALIQIIKSARVVYGMSRQGNAPAVLGQINRITRTPMLATLIITATVLGFALWFPLLTLAQMTSYLTLVVFALVNITAWRLHGRTASDLGESISGADPNLGDGHGYPRWLPMLGFIICITILVASVAIQLR